MKRRPSKRRGRKSRGRKKRGIKTAAGRPGRAGFRLS